MKQISATELAAWLGDAQKPKPQLLDVREPWEFETCHIAGSRHVPMGEIPSRASEVDPDSEIVVICHHGGRSLQVAMFLEKNGCAKVHNLSGGVDAWAKTVDPKMRVY
jgi:rhodanese-related sulfurtransferase